MLMDVQIFRKKLKIENNKEFFKCFYSFNNFLFLQIRKYLDEFLKSNIWGRNFRGDKIYLFSGSITDLTIP